MKNKIPAFDWPKGHSGFLLSEKVTAELNKMWTSGQD